MLYWPIKTILFIRHLLYIMILYIQTSLKKYYHDDIPESVLCTTSALTCLITATHTSQRVLMVNCWWVGSGSCAPGSHWYRPQANYRELLRFICRSQSQWSHQPSLLKANRQTDFWLNCSRTSLTQTNKYTRC